MESLFNKVASLTPILKNICQQLLLHYSRTSHCYLSVLLYIQHLLPHITTYLCLFFVQIQKASKNLNLVPVFTKVTFIGVIFFLHIFSVFLSFISFFLVAAHKKDSFKLSIY